MVKDKSTLTSEVVKEHLREDYEISEVELKNRVKKNFIRNKISLSLLNIIKYLESKIIFVFHLIRRLFFFNLL